MEQELQSVNSFPLNLFFFHLSKFQKHQKSIIKYRKMKTLKSLGLIVVFTAASWAFGSTALANPSAESVTENVMVKFRPGFIRIEGHYKVSRPGFVVWVPRHWRRI
jgi:hypothetical protein